MTRQKPSAAIIAAIGLMSVLPSVNSAEAHPRSGRPTPETVTGRVSEVEGEFHITKNAQGEDVLKFVDKSYVVITRTGEQIHLKLTPETKLPARANPGDRIEAKISNEGQALSVTLIQ